MAAGEVRINDEGNKQLALLGDAILRLVLIEEGYDHDEKKGW